MLRRMLYNYHSFRSMQRGLPADLRRFHRGQAQILARKLKDALKAPWNWETWCREHRPDLPKPPFPLT